jgi:16S rRNA (adenine1518-N6/adenine1519-N6)-dimethyltransferase
VGSERLLSTEHVQTKREIAELLKAAGAAPKKRLGQHFLIDGNLMRRLAACAEIMPDDLILEVGGGTGGLTDLLVARAGRVVCVELDRGLFGLLEDRFRDYANLTLIHGDILESKHRLRADVDELIREYGKPAPKGGAPSFAADEGREMEDCSAVGPPPLLRKDGAQAGCVKLVANLPYQVATPLVMNLLVDYAPVRRLCFTVQAEVGGRITARPDSKAYGPISIIAQALCTIETVARLPSHTFWPRPAVDSVMIRMDRVGQVEDLTDEISDPVGSQPVLHRFAALLRGVFDHRRKTLRSALGYVVDAEQRDLVCQHVDAKRRPESFSIKEWLSIFATLYPKRRDEPA